MGLRVSRKIGTLLLTIFLLLGLGSCDDLGNLELNISSNNQVNIVYTVLDQLYYEDLPLNLRRITTLEQLFEYTDPYTYIYKAESRDIERGEEYVGLGVTVSDHPLGLLVTNINIELDIDKEIYVGDIIYKVNDEELNSLTFEEKTNTLKGEEGDLKKLYLKRNNTDIVITRTLGVIPFQSISYQLFANKIGYIKINRFSTDTSEKFNEALNYLETEEISSLIIDVRDNGGGYLHAVTKILENFIVDENPYLYLYTVKSDEKVPYYSPLEEKKPYEIVALVNNNSASASEVLAGTLFKYGYDVFGEKTYGKDVFQSGIGLHQLSDIFSKDDILNLTMGYWLLNDETRVTGGLEPTIEHLQTGLKALEYPYLIQEYNKGELNAVTYYKGQANSQIRTYQYLLNNLNPFNYEAGLFGESTETVIKLYQIENSLEATGLLDVETQMKLIDYYRVLIKDSFYDSQLNNLISYLVSNES